MQGPRDSQTGFVGGDVDRRVDTARVPPLDLEHVLAPLRRPADVTRLEEFIEGGPAELEIGFGRAHHRAIHFIGRNPGIPVAELLGILRITKQSLSRVLGQLIERGFVEQRRGTRDRRQRLLHLTEAGIVLEAKVSAPQRARVAKAYREAGAVAVDGYRKVLMGLIDEEERAAILRSIRR